MCTSRGTAVTATIHQPIRTDLVFLPLSFFFKDYNTITAVPRVATEKENRLTAMLPVRCPVFTARRLQF